MAFSLSGNACAWYLRVFTEERHVFLSMRQDFNAWLAQQQRIHPGLDGKIHAGLPEDISVIPRGIHA